MRSGRSLQGLLWAGVSRGRGRWVNFQADRELISGVSQVLHLRKRCTCPVLSALGHFFKALNVAAAGKGPEAAPRFLLTLLDVAVCRIFMGPQSLEVPLRFQWIPGRCGQGASARPSFHFFITYIFWRALICQALFPRAMYPVTPWSLCGPSGPPRREASGGLPCHECTCIISDVILQLRQYS